MEGSKAGKIYLNLSPKPDSTVVSVALYYCALLRHLKTCVAVLLRHPLKSVLRNAREMIRWIIFSESTRIDHSEFAFSYSSQVRNLIFQWEIELTSLRPLEISCSFEICIVSSLIQCSLMLKFLSYCGEENTVFRGETLD